MSKRRRPATWAHSLEQLVEKHEGFRRYVYDDATGGKVSTLGHPTAGYGRNFDAFPVTRDEASGWLRGALFVLDHRFERRYAWYADLDDVRQAVVLDMGYNLGAAGFHGFARMRRALRERDYTLAAAEILDSQAGRQLRTRYRRLAQMMRSGQWPTR